MIASNIAKKIIFSEVSAICKEEIHAIFLPDDSASS
jgi:hypothetical protein